MAKKKTPLACSRCGKQCRYPRNCCTKEKKEERDAAEFGRKFEAAAIALDPENNPATESFSRAFDGVRAALAGLSLVERRRIIAGHAQLLGFSRVEV